jgi:hypothetical protein
MPKFYAKENGTLSNPYRFIEKDTVLDLTEEQAVFFAKSRWLRPVEEKRLPAPPLMSHMAKETRTLAEVYRPQDSSAHETSNYQANIEAIKQREALEDAALTKVAEENLAAAGSTIETTDGDAAQGTGNQDVLG